MGKIKELKEKRASVYQEIDALRKETDGRPMSAEERSKWDKLTGEHAEVSDQIQKEEQFSEIESRQAVQQTQIKDQQDGEKEYRSAFREYLLKGSGSMSVEARQRLEQRATLPGGLDGGAIVPTSMASAVEIALKSYGGMFEAGEIIMTDGGGDLLMPTVNDTDTKATIMAEYEESGNDSPVFGTKKLSAHTYRTKIVPISLELLQDSNFDVSGIISQLLADQLGRGANEHLTIGTGTNQPAGIVPAATHGADALADAISFDNIIDLMKGVDPAYARNGRFMFNNDTLHALMKVKDNNGQYIWQMSARDGSPAQVFGKGYVVNNDMAGIEPGATSVLFGELKKYKIRMVRNFQIMRLNEALAKYLAIGVIGFGRLDGALLDAGTHPVRSLKHATA